MAFECIRSETTEDGVLVLTLNDPATRNALGGQLSEELEGEVDRYGHDPALRVLVIDGRRSGLLLGRQCPGVQSGGRAARGARRSAPARPLGTPGSRLHGR